MSVFQPFKENQLSSLFPLETRKILIVPRVCVFFKPLIYKNLRVENKKSSRIFMAARWPTS